MLGIEWGYYSVADDVNNEWYMISKGLYACGVVGAITL